MSPSLPRIGVAQRRARLVHRQRLLPSAGVDVVSLARDLVVLHGTDAATVYLSVAARMPDVTVAEVEDALYGQRTLLRMLGMRRTMFVVPADFAATMQAAATATVAVSERRKLVAHLVRCAVGDDGWLAEVEAKTLAALDARGGATAVQLSTDVPELRTQVSLNNGKSYDVPQNITSRVLNGLSAQGYIVRGRPRGSWISTQYEWAPIGAWLPGGLTDVPPEQARADLARAWLRRYGPGTPADLKWWTGWTGAQTKAALAALDTAPVDLDGGATGVVLADDLDPVPEVGGVALLPALDPTVMGWGDREWYLGPHAPLLFDRTGNPGPTVWVDGRIVGGWAQRPDGEIAVRLLDDVGDEAATAVRVEADRLAGWLGPARVVPKFRTPLERDLAGS